MSSDENTDLLPGLGLTLNQAKVYLAILKLKSYCGTGSELSKVCREDVYRILPSLEKMDNSWKIAGQTNWDPATRISDALSLLVAEEKCKADERLVGMGVIGQKLFPLKTGSSGLLKRKAYTFW